MTNCLESLINNFFNNLNQKEIDFCILRGYEKLPNETRYDIDITIREEDFKITYELLENSIFKTDWIIFNTMERSKFYRVLLFNKNYPNKFLPIDFIMDFSYKGLTYCDIEELFMNTCKNQNFTIPLPHYEAYISLLGKVLPNEINNWEESKFTNLKKLIDENQKHFKQLLDEKFNKNISKNIVDFVNTVKRSDSTDLSNSIKKELRKKDTFTNIVSNYYSYFKSALIGKVKRRSSMELSGGFFVVLLGPDGSGKTTISDSISKELSSLFSGVDYYHGRFNLFPDLGNIKQLFQKSKPKEKKDEIDRNDLERRMVSKKRGIINILYYGLEYIIAKVIVTQKLKRNRLIICDRYFYDYLLHPEYKNINKSLTIFISRLVAQPDLVLLVKCKAEVIFNRKKELTLDEIKRQQNLLLEFNKEIKNTEFVDSSKDIVDTVDDSIKIIFDYINKDSDINKERKI